MSNQQSHKYMPNIVSPPGETLLDILKERGLTQADLSKRMGRPTKTINEIIKGKAEITPEIAIQLERVLGASAEFWTQREANYRSHLARKQEADRLLNQKQWLNKFPIKDAIKRGILPNTNISTQEQIIRLLNFFGVASIKQWKEGWTKRNLAFRKSLAFDINIEAISLWIRQGELEAEKINCSKYNKNKLISSIDKIRQLTIEQDPIIFIPKLKKLCAQCGVAIVFIYTTI